MSKLSLRKLFAVVVIALWHLLIAPDSVEIFCRILSFASHSFHCISFFFFVERRSFASIQVDHHLVISCLWRDEWLVDFDIKFNLNVIACNWVKRREWLSTASMKTQKYKHFFMKKKTTRRARWLWLWLKHYDFVDHVVRLVKRACECAINLHKINVVTICLCRIFFRFIVRAAIVEVAVSTDSGSLSQFRTNRKQKPNAKIKKNCVNWTHRTNAVIIDAIDAFCSYHFILCSSFDVRRKTN